MSTMYPITVNGTPIKSPSSFKISRYNLTASGRLAGGNMVMKLIAKKKKLFLTYEVITGTELQTILSLIDTNEMSFTVVYYDVNGSQDTITCYVGEIPTMLHRRGVINDDHVWKDVNIDFIEQ